MVWGAAMLMLVFIRDLGSSLMFFGAFLALLVATGRPVAYVLAGLVLFAVGALVLGNNIAHVQDRFDIWLDPFARNAPEGAGQVRQSLARRPTADSSARASVSRYSSCGPVRPRLPAAVPRVRQHPPHPAPTSSSP